MSKTLKRRGETFTIIKTKRIMKMCEGFERQVGLVTIKPSPRCCHTAAAPSESQPRCLAPGQFTRETNSSYLTSCGSSPATDHM